MGGFKSAGLSGKKVRRRIMLHRSHHTKGRWLLLLIVLLSGTGQALAQPFAYVANNGGGVSAYTINAGTGALTPMAGSPFAAGTSPTSVTVSPNGAFAYVANANSANVSAYTINGGTGALTPVAGSRPRRSEEHTSEL